MIREISYQVSSSGITPYTVQNAGVQGEQNVTRLSFTIDSNLLSKLTEAAKGATLYYRFDTYDSLGCSNSTEPIALEESQQVYYDIGLQLSAVGGNAKVYLVITAINEDKTEAELISVPALISFTKKAGAEYDQLQKESLSTLYTGVVKNAETAKNSEEISTENAERTEKARFALEKGAEFIFQGGNAQGSASVHLAVDSELSIHSSNLVENQAVAKEFLKYTPTKEADTKYVDKDSFIKTKEKAENTADYIIEQGITSGWYYIKYASGMAHLYKKVAATYVNNHVLGGSANFPFPIKTVYNATATINQALGGKEYWTYAWNVKLEYTKENCNAWLQSTTADFGPDNSLEVSVAIIGTWE